MTPAPARLLLHEIRKVGLGATDHEAIDGNWLRRFVACRDEAAFSALVRRHGPMVFGVGRRVLRDVHAAEDVFQATFVVLARNAKSIRKRESVGSWLHGVAYRLANKSKADAARRQSIERQKCEGEAADPAAEASWREYQAILDEELDRLPERLRVPLVMCYLEGQTRDEAARHVGWSLRTFDRRLGQGRALLGARLSRRGVTLGAALVTALLGEQTARASVPACLTEAAVKSALAHAAGSTGAALTSSIASMIEGFGKTTVWTKVALVAACLMGLTLAGTVGYVLVNAGRSAEPEPALARAEQNADSAKPNPDSGIPLPEGAVMRLGTLDRRAVGAKLAISADGKSIIGVRGGKYIHVWDAATGKLREKRELAVGDHWGRFWLSDDGRWLAMDRDKGVAIWDLQTDKRTLQLPIKRQGFVDRVVFSADYKKVGAVFHADGQTKHLIHAWNMADGKELLGKELRVTSGGSVLAFSPDGKRLLAAISSTEQGMHCWEIATGAELWTEKEFVPQSMIFTPDGKILSTDNKYRVVDPATGKPLPNNKVAELSWDMLPKLTPDGRTLLFSSPDGVIVWDMEAGKELRTLKGAGEEFVVAPDGKSIITNDGSLQRWDLATGRPLFADNFGDGHIGEVTSLVMSADGKRLASASSDGSVRLWDLTTGKPLHVWRGHEARRPVPVWRWARAGVTALDMTPDGRSVVSAGTEEKIRLHDAATGKEVQTISLPAGKNGEHDRRVFHLRIAADGTKAVAYFGAEGFSFAVGPGADPPPKFTHTLATWDLKTGKLANWRAVDIHSSRSLSPDGYTFFEDGVLTDIWTGQELARLEGITQGGIDGPVTFSADSALLVAVVAEETKKDGTTYRSPGGIRVWDAATGKTVAHLKTKSWVGQVTFHPNNRYIITNDYNGIQIWDATTGKVVAVRQMHEKVHSSTTSGSFAGCLAFTPDGRRLATGHPDSTILLWELAPPPSAPAPPAATELDTLWRDLADSDAAKAWRAAWRLVDLPRDAVPLLRDRIKPVEAAPAELTHRLIAELEDASFEIRRKALKQLKELGPRAEPALREALQGNPSAEQKKGINEALTALAAPQAIGPEAQRELRAVIVLERNGSPTARGLLTDLAKGVPEARLTRAANAALARLAQPNK